MAMDGVWIWILDIRIWQPMDIPHVSKIWKEPQSFSFPCYEVSLEECHILKNYFSNGIRWWLDLNPWYQDLAAYCYTTLSVKNMKETKIFLFSLLWRISGRVPILGHTLKNSLSDGNRWWLDLNLWYQDLAANGSIPHGKKYESKPKSFNFPCFEVSLGECQS